MASDTIPAGEDEEKKPQINPDSTKSSMEILSELFSSFDAEPPVIVKKEKTDSSNKKHKKSKKKHKHKDKKHKKKGKKRKRNENSASSSDESKIDLAKILIKQEKEASDKKKIKIEGTGLEVKLEITKKDKNEDKIKEKRKKYEDGELSLSDCSNLSSNLVKKEKKKKKRHKHNKQEHISESVKKKERSRSTSREKCDRPKDDLRHKLSGDKNKRDKEKSYRNSRERSRSRSRHQRKEYEFEERSRRSRENSFYKSKDEDKWFLRDRYRGYNDRDRHSRDRSISRESTAGIDKKKLLEIARKNAIQMMKSGSLPGALTLGPQAQEKVIAAIKAGGKTIEELTDFCKTLSKKEELGDLSSLSDKSNSSDSDTDKPFHHPFQIKDRPTSITMNIKNSVPLPIKSTQERSSELRMQFPVSSGQQHRKTENEWVPVPPVKKNDSVKTTTTVACINTTSTPQTKSTVEPVNEPVAVVPAPPNAPPGPQAFPTPLLEPMVDIGSIVSQRLTAMRRLQENPNDVQALTQMYKSNKEMQCWAQSKQQPGQFTGSTGAQILSQAELSSGYQAWAKKDQLQCAAPVSGGMGMHLLQKMGWKPGEGLGKEKTGTLEPLLLEVKLDKKGLVANEEQKRRKQRQQVPQGTNAQAVTNVAAATKAMQGKHPVSLLGEYASKRKLGAPQYILCFECGPDHKKNFLFKVILNGIEYKPNIASGNKKEAKAAAASVCLQQIGLLPPQPPLPPPT